MTDIEIQQAVLRELEWEPLTNQRRLAWPSKDGTVSLSGFLVNQAERQNIERAARRVVGVKVVAEAFDRKEVQLFYNLTLADSVDAEGGAPARECGLALRISGACGRR